MRQVGAGRLAVVRNCVIVRYPGPGICFNRGGCAKNCTVAYNGGGGLYAYDMGGGDDDPADVVLRRTAALLADLQRTAAASLSGSAGELAGLLAANQVLDPRYAEARYVLFAAACRVRRRIALANPLLDFDQLLFLKRHRSSFGHMCDQYYAVYQPPGGGLCVLSDPFGKKGIGPICPNRPEGAAHKLDLSPFSDPLPSAGGELLAMQRPPSAIQPDVDGTNPFSYPRLVQPVLDRHCVACHRDKADQAPPLDSGLVVYPERPTYMNRTTTYYRSYVSLTPQFGFYNYGGSGWSDPKFYRTTPGEFGARASKLYELLLKGHYDVQLPPEDLHRLTLWLDSCSLFYGVYEKEGGEAQLQGAIAKPTLE